MKKDRYTQAEFRALNDAKQPTLDGISRADHSNLGKSFEDELAHVHHFYLGHGLIDVVQNPNSWDFPKGGFEYQRTRENYEKGFNTAARTGNGYFMQRVNSDVDFSGGGHGFSVCFDAKATKGKSFPLANIAGHQVDRLVRSKKCGNCAGAMVKFTELARVFFIDAEFLESKFFAWERSKAKNKNAEKGTASISLAEFEESGREIFRDRINGNWDWLKILRGW